MAIGLLGGSFNPPHDAHRLITMSALKRLGLDRVWWLVSPGNPLKSHAELSSLAERVALARSLARHPRIKVTAIEAALGSSYTAHTLRYLKARCPGVGFVWLMGGDNLASFHRWRDWAQIFSLMPIAVSDRPSWRHRALNSWAARRFSRFRKAESRARLLPWINPPAWVYLTGPLSPLSSTALRARKGGAAVPDGLRLPGDKGASRVTSGERP